MSRFNAWGVFAFGMLYFLASPANCDPLYLLDSLQPGDKVAGSLKIGRRVIVIPSGEWQLVSKSERNPSSDKTADMPKMATLMFQEIVENRLNRILDISATTYSARYNWISEPCKNQNDSYWIDDRKRGMNDQDCIRISFYNGMVDGARGELFTAWARDIKTKKISYSPEMPYILVTRYSNYDYLSMSVRYNPSVAGIPASKERDRQFNDWNPKQLADGSAHRAFYDSMKEWAPQFDRAVNRAFDGDETLAGRDYGEPVLPRKAQ